MDNKGAIGMILRSSYLQACVMLNGKYLIFAAGQTILYMYTCRLLSTLMKRLRYRQDGCYSEYCRGFPTKDHPTKTNHDSLSGHLLQWHPWRKHRICKAGFSWLVRGQDLQAKAMRIHLLLTCSTNSQ